MEIQTSREYRIDDPVLKAFVKYILVLDGAFIGEGHLKERIRFKEKIWYEEIVKEIENLDASKACQDTDVSKKIFWKP